MKKKYTALLTFALILTSFPFTACESASRRDKNVLYVASWDEYIDEGGEDSYVENSRPLYEEFETWYYEQTNKRIKVEYVSLQDNETMYNEIKMGDSYDLLCPSEYMMMKLAEKNMLRKFPKSFFDTSIETNYYAKHLSPYIKEVFDSGKLSDGSSWSEYTAGYMWGSTGFVFNPEKIDRSVMQNWNCLTSTACNRQLTAKDNVRDSYFMGLGLHYEKELLALKAQYEQGEVSRETYKKILSEKMNDTSVDTMNQVKKDLEEMRENLYGLETDEGKMDIVKGTLDASYQWSGDAVYILDEAESEENNNPLTLEYAIPNAASNLWFDGWVMMNTIDESKVEAATMFVNFLSRPDNVIRNMYYIGYTSCIAGEEVLDYVVETYGADETETDTVQYDLSYFFGGNTIITTYEDQTRRQLFAQYPDASTIDRLVVMNYFDEETNTRASRMWNNIK